MGLFSFHELIPHVAAVRAAGHHFLEHHAGTPVPCLGTQLFVFIVASLTACAAWLQYQRWTWACWGVLAVGGVWLGALQPVSLADLGGLFLHARWLERRSAQGLGVGVQLVIVGLFFAHLVPGFVQHIWAVPTPIKAGCRGFDPLYDLDEVMAMALVLLHTHEAWARPPASWRTVVARAWPPALGLVALMIGPACAAGFVRFDPQLPAWWAPWLVHNLFLVVVPEELFFRGLIPRALRTVSWPRQPRSAEVTALSSVFFGLGHAGGGPVLVVLGTMAGWFYTLAGARAQNLAGSIVAHLLLNTVHFVFFSYPSLR